MTKTNMLLVVAFGTVFVLAVIGTLNKSNTAEVNTIEVEEVIKEVDILQVRVKTAQEAEMGSIEASAKEAYDKKIESELNRIEQEVKIEYIKELEGTITIN